VVGFLPGTDLRSSGLPIGTTASSSRTSTDSVVLTSGGCVRDTSGVRATTSAVAVLVAVAALNLAPVLRLRAVLGEVAVVVTVAAGDVVLYVHQRGPE